MRRSNVYNIALNLNDLFLYYVCSITVLNNILLLITWSCLSIPQASSSFELFDMHKFKYIAPTSITEVLFLVTQVQLF